MNSLMVPEESQIAREPSVMDILSQAVLSGKASVDVIERLTALQRQLAQDQAEREFNEAMNRCQQKMERIVPKDKSEKGKYANYASIDKVIRPIYTEEGFSLSFGEGEPLYPDYIRLICYVSRGGHTRKYHKDWPIVTTGAKGNEVMNKTHAHGSADSYAKRYLLKDIFNVAVGADDDDAAGVGPEITTARNKLLHGMERAQGEDQLTSLYRAGVKDALAAKDYAAIPMFDKLRDKRRRELAGEID